MFDVDGTLVESYDFDGKCYVDAVYSVLGHHLNSDWRKYNNVTDAGISVSYTHLTLPTTPYV